MAFNADTGDYDLKRSDMFTVDPRALVVNWKMNLSREGQEPPVDDDLKTFARSLKPKTMGGSGQLQPVVVRLLDDRRLELMHGFRRTRAGLWLIESGECPDFKIQCVIRKSSDAEAAMDNLVENLDRLEITPLGLAFSIRSMLEDYGYSMDDVVGKLRRPKAWVEERLNLVELSPKMQKALKNGEISVMGATEILKAPKADREFLFDTVKTSGGKKVTATAIKDIKRKKQEESPEKDKSAPIGRTLKHLREFLVSQTGPADNKDGARLANLILDYLKGSKTEEQMQRGWTKAFPNE